MKLIDPADPGFDPDNDYLKVVAEWINDFPWLLCGWDCGKCGLIILQKAGR